MRTECTRYPTLLLTGCLVCESPRSAKIWCVLSGGESFQHSDSLLMNRLCFMIIIIKIYMLQILLENFQHTAQLHHLRDSPVGGTLLSLCCGGESSTTGEIRAGSSWSLSAVTGWRLPPVKGGHTHTQRAEMYSLVIK